MKRRLQSRSGFTLIETLTYMFCAVILLSLAVQLIHTSLGISTEAKQQWQLDATLSRLTRDLRRDLTHSLTTAYDSESGKLTVTLEDGAVVTWTFAKESVLTEGTMPHRRQISTEFRETNESYILPERIRTEMVYPPNSSSFQLRVTTSNQYLKDGDNRVRQSADATEHVKLIRIVHGSTKSEVLNNQPASQTSNQSTSAQTSSTEKLQ